MSDDLIILVPPGTRVRYVESQYVDKPTLINADALKLDGSIIPDFERRLFTWGLPVYDATKIRFSDDTA